MAKLRFSTQKALISRGIWHTLRPPGIGQIVNFKAISNKSWFRSAAGAVLATLCGWVLWNAPMGDAWVNASYDYIFRFGQRTVTNEVVVILMDNDAHNHFQQVRGQPWDRGLHAQLLQKLADDGCAMVVFDSFFRVPNEPAKDEALAAAMRRQRRVVLMAKQDELAGSDLTGATAVRPCEPFLSAAGTNWGVAWFDADPDSVVRRHWPFPSPAGPYPSLPWITARLAGASLPDEPQERWLRYYGQYGTWTRLGCRFALVQATNYFRGKIVFIGSEPETLAPDGERDEFRTPYTRWPSRESMGGVQINITAFLNLMNGDWLRRPARWLEALVLLATGTLLGGALCRMRLLMASILALAFALVVALGAVSWSHFTNYWFPWLVIAGGQLPCAFVWAVAVQRLSARERELATAASKDEIPDTPGYELVHPAFGRGAYGKVWLARNATGQWRALKAVYLSKFEGNADPYEREFKGIKKYQPVSDKHSGLLRVDFVSEQNPAGYFYYVMELGDSLQAGWEGKPATYKPRDLASERNQTTARKVTVRECVRIGLVLADALEFLHRQGLTHRDIKPQNVIFVNGRPKLADLGLVAEIRPPDQTHTYVGTPGYLPPPPEQPGTPQADIYALGVMLYVLSTGRTPTFFPEISTTLADSAGLPEFFQLNSVILKACNPDCAQRYTSAAEVYGALLAVQESLKAESSGKPSSGVH